ncbi:unnamed protein product [Lymnaea stagnalis]|uniref:tRNA pseudouridine synthase n=1 Tax=Lymnaea stagnalis TaxID=6523 RepID=A0AAV2IAV0_LYMST
MGRFLMFFSYVGSRYRGLQRQNALVKGDPIPTIEGALHQAMTALQPANSFKIVLSSRTDSGVHAIKNACQVDLTFPEEGKEYEPSIITSVVNYHLRRRKDDVRVLETKRVPDSFQCRFMAQGREYVYRLAFPKQQELIDEREKLMPKLMKFRFNSKGFPMLPLGDICSVLDVDKTALLRETLDIGKLLSAAQLLSGIHNFESFTANRKSDDVYQPHPVKMLTIGVKRGQPFGFPLQGHDYKVNEVLEFWDIHVQSKSFLYRQVRRVVGAMVLVAKGAIQLSDLQDILENPQKDFKFSGQMVMNEAGLYLLDVKYNPKDLIFSPTKSTEASASGLLCEKEEEMAEKPVDGLDEDSTSDFDNLRPRPEVTASETDILIPEAAVTADPDHQLTAIK